MTTDVEKKKENLFSNIILRKKNDTECDYYRHNRCLF